MIEFILGGAGSGKSALITERILSDLKLNKKVMLIVPEQAALSTESAICFEAQRQNISTLDLEVLNFSRLCNRAFRQYGGISYSSVTPGAKALILWDALFSSIPFLKHYKTEIEDADKFVNSLSSLFEEFKAYNITPSMLSEASEEALGDNEKLSSKLSDLSLVYSSYISLLNEKWDDPSDDLTKLALLLERNAMFSDVNVYIHSFKGFTPQQFAVLREIFKQAVNVTVTLTMRDDKNSFAFESVKETKKALTSLTRSEPIITFLSGSDRSEEIAFLERNLWNHTDNESYDKPTDAVRSIVCENPYEEAEFVASDILEQVRSGARYRDFAVIARDIERYNGIIDAVFEKYGLPCRVFDKIQLSEKPLFKLIISALNIRNGSWSTDDVMVYLKTGLCPITSDEIDLLESYVFTWNIRGSQWTSDNGWFMNPDGYTDKLTEDGEKLIEQVNDIRLRIVRPLEKLHESLDGKTSVKGICNAVYTFLTELEVDKKIAEEDDDDEVRLWNCLCDALDTLCDTLGERKADAKLFYGLFNTVVSQSSIGALPSTIDEITVGSANLLRADAVKHTYILGLNENVFPAEASQNSFFSDADKIYLETCGVSLSPTTDRLFYEELYFFYTAVTSAKNCITLLSSDNDTDGKNLRPSVAFNRIRSLMPNSPLFRTSQLSKTRLINTPKQSFEYLYSLGRCEESEALRRAYLTLSEFRDSILSEKQPLEVTNEKLDDSVTSDIFKENIYLTQSRLDKFVLCSFSYQCAYTLKLKENKRAEFSPADTGNLIHRVLEKFFSQVLVDEKVPDISDTDLDKQIDQILNDYICGIFGKDADINVSKRSYQLFMRLKRTLKILIRNLLNEFKESEFVPSFFEMGINESGDPGTVSPLEFPLPGGGKAVIYGVVDRVDTCKRGDNVYVRVIDYKTGKKEFNLADVALGLNMQMLIYLFSIWNDKGDKFKKMLGVDGEVIPTGVLYLKSKLDDVKAEPDTDPRVIYELAEKSLKRNGLVINDEEILRLMEKKLSGKYIPVSLKKNAKSGESIYTKASLSSLHTLEEFGALRRSIEETVTKLASEMRGGKADCKPLRDKRNDGCKYCQYSAVCRSSDSFNAKEDKVKFYG